MVRANILLSKTDIIHPILKEELDKLTLDTFIKKITINKTVDEKFVNAVLGYLGETLDSFEGDVVLSNKVPYSKIEVTCSDNSTKSFDFIVKDYKALSLIELDEVIGLNVPRYLIMSTNTLSMLKKIPDAAVDHYPNFGHCYHSYRKIPIAICEFLDPGIIDLALDKK